jgi:hypothetical protein
MIKPKVDYYNGKTTEQYLKEDKAYRHGGKRKGAGRKPKEPTKRMSIPISKLEAVKKLIQK